MLIKLIVKECKVCIDYLYRACLIKSGGVYKRRCSFSVVANASISTSSSSASYCLIVLHRIPMIASACIDLSESSPPEQNAPVQ